MSLHSPTLSRAEVNGQKANLRIDGKDDDEDQNTELDEEEASFEPPPKRTRQKIARVDKINTRSSKYVKSTKPRNVAKKYARYVIVVARVITAQGVWAGHYEIVIRGKLLCEKLTNIFKETAKVSFDANAPLDDFETELLFHAIKPLEIQLEDANKRLESQGRQDVDEIEQNELAGLIFELEAGLEFIREHHSGTLMELGNLVVLEMVNPITFELVWTLFEPGTLLYANNNLGDSCIYRARYCQKAKAQDGTLYWKITAEYVDSDGIKYGVVRAAEFAIPMFPGAVCIPDLEIFPFKYHPRMEDETQAILKRADKALELKGACLQEYKGRALNKKGVKFNLPKYSANPSTLTTKSHGRIILDAASYDRLYPEDEVVPYIRHPIPVENFTEEHKLLLSAVMYGFSLGDKIWGSFSVARCEGVQWNEKIVDKLVIPEEKKSFICSLVRAHGSDTEGFDDIVRDKGKGLIGLLSGPPGVGKTLTAEVVAEVAKRPLYMLSSGEMGDTLSSVQEHLDKTLELTEAWNAVLLLDEADVFLAQRDSENLQRNAITSVFLRKLEYYRGILLLTTNRLSSIDAAFQSRVHFFFQYSDLDVAARRTIWQTFLGIAAAGHQVTVDISPEDIEALAKIYLNGRQIKNIVSSSQAYAAEVKKPITLGIIRTAASFSEWT
ncbi:ATP-dependent zinc metalloprotease FtsH [Drechslerella dactyloides]|uniref:ATP-dependent zinc metalloprotease FtsH n=1 Tax=Drechslerella dactyloides TaxID=74499 RepID=A0AAD6NFL7_DREDA|nr:ATP-dependent zinc metalloprotease FtsH [Drechslerella dactyloides]